MGTTVSLSDKTMWLLATIDSSQYVDGDTRLQKYSLLVSKIVLSDYDHYDDWESNNYGAFSPQVNTDIEYLTNNGLVSVSKVYNNYYGHEHNKYSLTDLGRSTLKSFKEKHTGAINNIKKITDFYFKKSLDDLLVDAYTLFPEYTEKSRIKALVRRTWLKRESKTGSNYKLPFTDKKFDFSLITSTAQVNPFMYNDEEIRRKLAGEAGLDDVPKLDIIAYDELSDVFADKEYLKDVDLSKTVKEIRIS